MRPWTWLLAACLALPLTVARPALAEGLHLTVTNDDGTEEDLLAATGDQAVVCFMRPDRMEEKDVDDVVKALGKILADLGDEGNTEDDIDVIIVLIAEAGDWDALNEALEEDDLEIPVVFAPPDDDELVNEWKLPDDLVWGVVHVENQQADPLLDSLEELIAACDELTAALKGE